MFKWEEGLQIAYASLILLRLTEGVLAIPTPGPSSVVQSYLRPSSAVQSYGIQSSAVESCSPKMAKKNMWTAPIVDVSRVISRFSNNYK